jgi:hypothetical protein
MPKFSKDNQPTRRKGGTPPDPDTSGGLDPAVIDKVINEPQKREHLPRPRPHTKVFDPAPSPRPEDVADLPLDQALLELREIEQAAREQEHEQQEQRKRADAEILAARQKVDKAKRTIEEQRLAERAQQIAAEAEIMDRQRVDRTAERARAEDQRVDIFRAKLEKDLLPVAQERLALQAFEQQYVPTLLVVEKKIYSKTPDTWPPVLRARFDSLATQAHGILKDLREFNHTLDHVLGAGDRLLKKGPGPVFNDRSHPAGYHERQREISEMDLLLKNTGRGNYIADLQRRIDNMIRDWADAIDEAKRHGGSTVEQSVPSAQDQSDPVRDRERQYRIEQVAGFGGVVRDGAHEPERSDEEPEQTRAHPGRIDPVRDLPRPTSL